MDEWKKILIAFGVGLLIGAAALFIYSRVSTRELREKIDIAEGRTEAISGRLEEVQGDLDQYAARIGDIAEEVTGLSDEAGQLANSLAGASGGINSVIEGLERSIEFAESIAERVGRLEKLVTGVVIEGIKD